MISLFIAMI